MDGTVPLELRRTTQVLIMVASLLRDRSVFLGKEYWPVTDAQSIFLHNLPCSTN